MAASRCPDCGEPRYRSGRRNGRQRWRTCSTPNCASSPPDGAIPTPRPDATRRDVLAMLAGIALGEDAADAVRVQAAQVWLRWSNDEPVLTPAEALAAIDAALSEPRLN